MEYHIKLDLFEGPLDLLLHLVHRSKIEISDISISDITEQYLDYLNKMKDFDVEIASEFLVMASTLLLIKSKALLPRIQSSEEENQDYEKELLERLTEYKKFKEVSLLLKEMQMKYSNIYFKLPDEIIDQEEKNIPWDIEGDPRKLLSIFMDLAEREKNMVINKVEYSINRQTITIEGKIKELKILLSTASQLKFQDMFTGFQNRPNIIITFLALLEMLRDNQISIYQEDQFGDIIIKGVV